jgi:hypothetical protein
VVDRSGQRRREVGGETEGPHRKMKVKHHRTWASIGQKLDEEKAIAVILFVTATTFTIKSGGTSND